MKCSVCGESAKSLASLHRHISTKHKLSQSDYYHQFSPRYDLHTGDLIVYKDRNQYFSTDFNDRESFLDWLADHYKEEKTKEYCITKIRERMTRKTISALPSQVSLKSIMLPSINGFEKIYGNIESFVKGMGLCEVDLKYDYLMEPVFKGGVMEICIDTREQDPLPVRGKIQKLSVGDYVPNKDFYADVYIDRKSLPDLVGTLTSGYDMVVREIERAKEMEFYLVFLVEDLFSSALNYSGKFTKWLNGSHIMHQSM